MSIIKGTYKAQQVREGAGIIVNRVFGYGETEAFDPFLMLDYFDEREVTDSPGVPWHPHKGMETISYFLRGSGEHQDSLGNKGIISAGELQWMSAGKGIMHQEMPGSGSKGAQGLQFWVNLPANEKLKEPEYQYIRDGGMKDVVDEGVTVKIIAGHYQDVIGPIDKSDRGITMLHIIVDKDSEITLTRAPDKQGFVFVVEGDGWLDGELVAPITAYTLDDGPFIIKAASNKMEIIYAEGIPIKEPIAWYGPIVMNTREEINQTYRDLENGTFI